MIRRRGGGSQSPAVYTKGQDPSGEVRRASTGTGGPATRNREVFSVRLDAGELSEVQEAAELRGLSRSAWGRGVLVMAARRALGKEAR